MNKDPNQMSIIELKALIFDLRNDAEICMQILNRKLQEQRQQPEIQEVVELKEKNEK